MIPSERITIQSTANGTANKSISSSILLSEDTFQRLLEEEINQKAGANNRTPPPITSEEEKEKERKRLRELCQEFESLFIYQMLKGMSNTVMKSDLLQEAPGRQIWESMLDEEYSKQMAKREELGLAKMLYQELSRNLK